MIKMFGKKWKNKRKSQSGSEPKTDSRVGLLDNFDGDLHSVKGPHEQAAALLSVGDVDRAVNAKEKKSTRIKRSGSKLLSIFRRLKSGSTFTAINSKLTLKHI